MFGSVDLQSVATGSPQAMDFLVNALGVDPAQFDAGLNNIQAPTVGGGIAQEAGQGL